MTGASGSFDINGGLLSAKVSWQQDYDVTSNSSVISITAIELTTIYNYNKAATYPRGTVSADGTAIVTMDSTKPTHTCTVTKDEYHEITAKGSYPAAPWASGAIAHNADGTKSAEISIQLRGVIGNTTSQSWAITGSETVTLTPIPRASSIQSLTAACETAQSITITMTKAEPTAKHKATVTADGVTLYTDTDFFDTSESITAQRAWFVNYPNDESFTATVSIQTYSSDGTAMGEPVSGQCVITADENMAPGEDGIHPWFSFSPANDAEAAGFNVYIQGHSAARCVVYPQYIKTNMLYGATIDHYEITVEGKTVTFTGSSGTSDVLQLSGWHNFDIDAVDTRGRRLGGREGRSDIYAYAAPLVIMDEPKPVYRSNSAGIEDDIGAYIRVKAKAQYSSIGGRNTYTLTAAIAQVGGQYGTETSLQSGTAQVLGAGGISIAHSYNVRVTITDALGLSSSTVRFVPTSAVVFNLNADGAAFGKYCESANTLELAQGWKLKLGSTSLTEAQLIQLLNMLGG